MITVLTVVRNTIEPGCSRPMSAKICAKRGTNTVNIRIATITVMLSTTAG